MEFPYKAEYARSGRAACKLCKLSIAKGNLRIAAMVQSAFHDGKQPNWFHEQCFFKKQRPLSVDSIENFESLRLEDQQRIEKSLRMTSTVIASKSGKKRSKNEIAAMKDFGIEYAKSGRAVCRGCEQKILKSQIRVQKTVYDTEVGMKYGGQALWHHLECFAQLRGELGWLEKGEMLPGFKSLSTEDQNEVHKVLPALKNENMPTEKKMRIDPNINEEEKQREKLFKNQSKRLFYFRDNCQLLMSKSDMIELLELNKQEPVSGDSEKLMDQLADLLTFGAIQPCPDCLSTQILFQKCGYVCNGQLTEWTKCAKLIKEPKRGACKIPSTYVEKYKFLSDVLQKPENRVIRSNLENMTQAAPHTTSIKTDKDGCSTCQ